MKIWLAWVLTAISVLTVAGARAQVIEREPEPEDWLAFVSHSAGWARTYRWITASTPEITLYRDGRAVWIEHGAQGSKMWRVGTLAPDRLIEVRAVLKRSGLLELPIDPPRKERQEIFDAGAMRAGYRDGERSRTVEVDAPSMFGGLSSASFAVRGAIEIEHALRMSLPRDNQPFKPERIRVGLLHAQNVNGSAVEWPLNDPPKPYNSSAGSFNYYSGESMSQVIAALDKSGFVRVGGTVYEAYWAPAMASPDPGLEGFAGGKPKPPTATVKPDVVLAGHTDAVTCVRWSPSGQHLVTATPNTDGPRIWNALSGALVRQLKGHGPNYSVDWSPDSKRLIFGATGIFLRDVKSGELTPKLGGRSWFVDAVAWSPDGKYLALEAPLQLASADSDKQLWQLERERISGIAFVDGGKSLACASSDGSVVLRRASNGDIVRTLRGPLFADWASGIHFPIAVSQQRVAVPGLSNGTIQIWNAKTGAQAAPLKLDGPTPNSLAWSRDGRTLVATAGLTLWLWDVKTGKRRTIQSASELYCATWSRDGRRIAAGCADGTVRIWKAEAARAG